MDLYNYMFEQAAKDEDYKFVKKLIDHRDNYYRDNPSIIEETR